jgi:hypothetical protein
MAKQINVVLGRGLLGNVYSRGMDALGAKVAKIEGVDYATVEDYTNWRSTRDRIARWKDPTIIGGHSFYANAATIITESLPKIEFPFIFTVDPSPYWSWSLWQSGPSPISKNVKSALNLYQNNGLIGRQTIARPGGGTNGIVNWPVNSTHTAIDDLELVHNAIISEIRKVIAA